MQAQPLNATMTADKPVESLIQRIWPPVGIGFGLGLTAAWVSYLGYGLITLIGL